MHLYRLWSMKAATHNRLSVFLSYLGLSSLVHMFKHKTGEVK